MSPSLHIFFASEKKRATDRYISALRASDGSLVFDKDGLCNLLRSFYLDLFTAVPCDSSARAELLFRDRTTSIKKQNAMKSHNKTQT